LIVIAATPATPIAVQRRQETEMNTTALANTFIRYAPLSRRIVLARFGKDKDVALETKDSVNDFLQVLIQYAFDDGKIPSVGDEAEVSFGAGDEQFVLTVKRVTTPEPRP
jgi:hypothetical protein